MRIREGFLEEEGLEAGGAQQLPGQGPHILWDCLSPTSPSSSKDQSQFFLSPYGFHPELGSAGLERNWMLACPGSDNLVGETERLLSKSSHLHRNWAPRFLLNSSQESGEPCAPA